MLLISNFLLVKITATDSKLGYDPPQFDKPQEKETNNATSLLKRQNVQVFTDFSISKILRKEKDLDDRNCLESRVQFYNSGSFNFSSNNEAPVWNRNNQPKSILMDYLDMFNTEDESRSNLPVSQSCLFDSLKSNTSIHYLNRDQLRFDIEKDSQVNEDINNVDRLIELESIEKVESLCDLDDSGVFNFSVEKQKNTPNTDISNKRKYKKSLEKTNNTIDRNQDTALLNSVENIQEIDGNCFVRNSRKKKKMMMRIILIVAGKKSPKK